jgi:hypothetical protein
LASGKMAPTASSPVVKLVVIPRSSLVFVGDLWPSSWTSSLQVVPTMNAPMTSESVTLGSSVHCLEKRQINSWRVSSSFWWQLLVAASEVPSIPRVHICALKIPHEDPDQVGPITNPL